MMQSKEVPSGIKFFIVQDGKEVARIFLYVLHNDLHQRPFGLIEDLFVDEQYRSQGFGNMLLDAAINAAKEKKCYKLICTSRHERTQIHEWYKRHGFKDYGVEFRMDL